MIYYRENEPASFMSDVDLANHILQCKDVVADNLVDVLLRYKREREAHGKIEFDFRAGALKRTRALSSGCYLPAYANGYDVMFSESLIEVLLPRSQNLPAMKSACSAFVAQVWCLNSVDDDKLTLSGEDELPTVFKMTDSSIHWKPVRFVYGLSQFIFASMIYLSGFGLNGVMFHNYDTTKMVALVPLVFYVRYLCCLGVFKMNLPIEFTESSLMWMNNGSLLLTLLSVLLGVVGQIGIFEVVASISMMALCDMFYSSHFQMQFGYIPSLSKMEICWLVATAVMDVSTLMAQGLNDEIDICKAIALAGIMISVYGEVVVVWPNCTASDVEKMLFKMHKMDFVVRTQEDSKLVRPDGQRLESLKKLVDKIADVLAINPNLKSMESLKSIQNYLMLVLSSNWWSVRDEMSMFEKTHSLIIGDKNLSKFFTEFNHLRSKAYGTMPILFQVYPSDCDVDNDSVLYYVLFAVAFMVSYFRFDIIRTAFLFPVAMLIIMVGRKWDLGVSPICFKRDLLYMVERRLRRQGLMLYCDKKLVMPRESLQESMLPSIVCGLLLWCLAGLWFNYMLHSGWHSSAFHFFPSPYALYPLAMLGPLFRLKLPISGDYVDKNKSGMEEAVTMIPYLQDLEDNAPLNSMELSTHMKIVMKYFNNGKTNAENMSMSNLSGYATEVINWALDASQHYERFYSLSGPCSRNLAYTELNPLVKENANHGPGRDMFIPDGCQAVKLPSYPNRPKGNQSDRYVRNPYIENLARFLPKVKKACDDHCMTVPDEDNVWAGWVKRRAIPHPTEVDIDFNVLKAAFIATMRRMSVRSIGKRFHRVRLQDYIYLEHNPKSSVGYIIRTKYGEKQAFLFRNKQGIIEVGSLFEKLLMGTGIYAEADPFGKFEVKRVKEVKPAFGYMPPQHGNFTRSIIPQDGILRTLSATFWIPCHEEWMKNNRHLEHAIGQLFYGINQLAQRMADMLRQGKNVVIKSDCDNWDGRLLAFLMHLAFMVELSGFEPRDERDCVITDRIVTVTFCDYVWTVEVFPTGMRMLTFGRVPSGFGNTSSGNSTARNLVDKIGTIHQYNKMPLGNRLKFLMQSQDLQKLCKDILGDKDAEVFINGNFTNDPSLLNKIHSCLHSVEAMVYSGETVESVTGGDDDMMSIPKRLFEFEPEGKRDPMLNMRDYFAAYSLVGVVARDYAVATSIAELEFYSQRVRRLPLPIHGNQCRKQYVLWRDPSDSIGRLSFLKRPVRFMETKDPHDPDRVDYLLDPEDQAFVAGVAQSMLITNFFSKSVRLVCRYVLAHCQSVKSHLDPNAPMSIIYPTGYKWEKMYRITSLPMRVLSDSEIFEIVAGYPLPKDFVGDIPCVDDTSFLEPDPDCGLNLEQILKKIILTKPPTDHNLKEWVMEHSVTTAEMVMNMLKRTTPITQSVISTLPVRERQKEVLALVENSRISILTGGTGSGKSTQIPQILHENKLVRGKIYVVQPRRIAAKSVAERVNYEISTRDQKPYPLGSMVGVKTRTDNVEQRGCRIVFVTDGVAANLLLSGQLGPQDFLIIDEAHERTLFMDLMMIVLKHVKKDVRAMVMSATIETKKFKDYFQAPVLDIPGKMYDVTVYYESVSNRNKDPIEPVAARVAEIHLSQKTGDILIFAPGEQEINKIIDSIKKKVEVHADGDKLHCHKLMSTTSQDNQRAVFEPPPEGHRKCVVSTNVAETSLTIDGIVYVIDTCLVKETRYDLDIESDVLSTFLVSKARADQRKGRAGRTKPGICYRMCTKGQYDMYPIDTMPLVRTSDLTELMLVCKKYGLNYKDLDWIDPPTEVALAHFDKRLRERYLVTDGAITPLGELVTNYPCDVDSALFLIQSVEYGCADLACLAVAAANSDFMLLPTKSQKMQRQKRSHNKSEVVSWVKWLIEHGSEENREVAHRYGMRSKAVVATHALAYKLKLKIMDLQVPYLVMVQNDMDGLYRLLRDCPHLRQVRRGVDRSLRTENGHLVKLSKSQPTVSTDHFTCFRFMKIQDKLSMIGATAY